MSSTIRLKQLLKNLVVTRLWNSWARSYIVSTVVRRCRRERGVRDFLQCFRFALLRPSRTLLLSVAAMSTNDNEEGPPEPCEKGITDEELKGLVNDFDSLEELSRRTVYCDGCARRVRFDKKQQGVLYCACKDGKPPEKDVQGWVPFMEADDVIIWRKEYKGPGMYAYKVYGHYKDITARDFAAVQVDGAYRKAWDDAVASLAVVERGARGKLDQVVLHWEVLWPRLFANRDYVYVRRHADYDIQTICKKHTDGLFNPDAPCGVPAPEEVQHVKRETEELCICGEEDTKVPAQPAVTPAPPTPPTPATPAPPAPAPTGRNNKVFVIISRSCTHQSVPETRSTVRVKEYWSHMVIRTIDGPDKAGTEFVLTYYDEPAAGGMPTAVASFAAARGAPVFLAKMRRATHEYRAWKAGHSEDLPDFTPTGVSYEAPEESVKEEDMETSKQGPELDSEYGDDPGRDKNTQTEGDAPLPADKKDPSGNKLDLILIDNKATEGVLPRLDRNTPQFPEEAPSGAKPDPKVPLGKKT